MNNPFDNFDAIYCINLDHRKDRWEQCQLEFDKVGILDKVRRFPAVKHNDGRVGIIKSNLAIVRNAKVMEYKNVLVFEDDVKFLEPSTVLQNLSTAFEQATGLNIDWSLFYLGANTHTKLQKLSPNIVRLTNAYAVHSMAYSSKVYDKFIDYASKVNYITRQQDILDVWLADVIQANEMCLMVNPMLTTQRESYSDIEKRFVNYSFIEERFNKNIK